MQGMGLFSEEFSVGLGDLLEIDDGDGSKPSGNPNGDIPQAPQPKAKSNPFPALEGTESASEYVAKYKKALLNRRTVFKEVLEKWEKANPTTGKTFRFKFDCSIFI